MSAVSAVPHVRRILARAQYDGGDPVDVSDDYDIDEQYPAGMMAKGAGLIFWCGTADSVFAVDASPRYIATERVRAVATAPKRKDERVGAVAARVTRWLLGALGDAPVTADGLMDLYPESVQPVPMDETTRAGRAIVECMIAAEYEYDH